MNGLNVKGEIMKFKKKKHNFVFVFKNKKEAEATIKILKTMLKIMQKNKKNNKDISYFTKLISDCEKQINTSKRKISFSVKEKDISSFMEFVIIMNGLNVVKGDIEKEQKEVIKLQEETIDKQHDYIITMRKELDRYNMIKLLSLPENKAD